MVAAVVPAFLICAGSSAAAVTASSTGPAGPTATVRHHALERQANSGMSGGGEVLVYEGNESYDTGDSNNSYFELEAATGRGVRSTTTLPGSLSGNSCVLLQLNNESFDPSQVSTLRTYIQQGGVVVGIGEYSEYDEAADNVLNALAASLNANLAFQDNSIDPDYHETTNIGGSQYASGVSSLVYADTSGLDIGSGAEEIAATEGGIPFIGAQSIGSGALVLLGDSNVLSDESGSGYFAHDNGVLARNLCGGGSRFSRPWPIGGYGYSFANRGMSEYAGQTGLRPSDILIPSKLSSTFADWEYNPILSGRLPGVIQEEIEAFTGWGPIGFFWRAMDGGTCYGLALSGGRFDDEAEPLFSPSRDRGDVTWNVGSGPSASTLLPEPYSGRSSDYNKQFLQLDADDFETQFSREAQSSFNAQARAYASPSTGVAALREQLESVMGDGTDLYGSLHSPPNTNFALITLMVRDSRSYGHAVLAYSFEELSGGGLKIDVWDNNFPGTPYSIIVNPDGTWNYEDAPYPTNNGYRFFGATYAMYGKAGYARGNLYALPLYVPSGLHLYPGSGSSIVDVGAGTVASDPQEGGGGEPQGQLTLSNSLEYEGESFLYESDEGSIDIGGSEPRLDVRGADSYMTLDASGATEVTENAAQGYIGGSGALAELTVARDEIVVASKGTSSLAVSGEGGVQAVTDNSGEAQIKLKFDQGGSIGTATLFSGPTTPGATLAFSPAEVAAAQTPKPVESESSSPAQAGSPPQSPQIAPAPSPPITKHHCHKGKRRKRVHGKARCVRVHKHRRHRHKHRRHRHGPHHHRR